MNLKLKNKLIFSKSLQSVGYITNKSMFFAWLRLIVWSLQIPKIPYMMFGTRIWRLWTTNGPTFVCQYTKECTRIVQAFISGNPVLVTQYPISIKGGLPGIIPGPIRSRLRDGDLVTSRAVLSVFSVYRVINIPGVLKLSTITDLFEGQSPTLLEHEVTIGLGELNGFKKPLLHPIRLLFLGTACPNNSISMLGIWKDIWAWKNSHLWDQLVKYCQLAPGGENFLSLITREIEYLSTGCYKSDGKPLILGKLSEKVEAAGKIRVFAITDSITQSLFKPLSDSIFKILDSLPMDGTFDQDRPVRYLRALFNSEDKETFYSYDLSAATDRLPILLQHQVLTRLIGKDMSDCWVKILTDRNWYHNGKPYRYSVGQPMGALSSWAMLALTHHVLVRIAANRVGFTNFTKYAILGDDVVIVSEIVARSYHTLLTQTLGVKINLSKSLISKHSFEFAKRLVTSRGEVSPVGAKNLLVGLKSLNGIPSILLDLVNKGYYLTEDQVTNLYKSVPTIRKSQLERLSWFVKGPFGFIPTADGLSTSLKLSNSLSAVSMDRFLSSLDEAKFRLNLTMWERNLGKTNDIIRQLLNLQQVPGFTLETRDSPLYLYMLDRYWSSVGELVANKPVRRFVFDGPLVFTNYYRESWKFEMMDYIKTKIKDDSDETVSLLDPFESQRVTLPLSSSAKADNFWLMVKEIEDEKTSLLNFRGLI